MALTMNHSQSHQELEKLFGEETKKLSPSVKDIIAQALQKVRQKSHKQSGSA
jgi:hypothetical protein